MKHRQEFLLTANSQEDVKQQELVAEHPSALYLFYDTEVIFKRLNRDFLTELSMNRQQSAQSQSITR